MPSFIQLTAALALTSSVLATPVERRDAFTVKQVAGNTFRKNGALNQSSYLMLNQC
jgi:hypothetical protein